MKRFLILIGFISLVILLAACGSKELENTLDWEVQSFEGTTQSGRNFSTDDMEGKVWLANFIFTNCNTVCPPMTRNMVKVQEQLKEKGIDAEIVSFSVDPTVDHPDVLKEFGKQYGADFSNWTFVTEYSQEDIKTFAQESFQTIAVKTEGNDQVDHGTSFYLIGKDGLVKKKYRGNIEVPFDQIIEDTKTLAD
ncbi:protein SCO1/2 [Halobacillus karajensis]|uniref:BsSco n=1 Tax=Halobacillus karajensis TaxID=195088 RepID=A0A024PAQ7_9BACI|nr:SCO family protein [Halobacillus karajensis]CDQ21582.1 BsSco [Halobacillus karajensis]CDQ25517.1 BsSco [Halobacillus karajensis]CDQ28953.1 BsSco [Halobacillus karajensis]SEI08763.1 protein SCO1/2 [Halobacillus karajensis]